jgi:hypothetical protein
MFCQWSARVFRLVFVLMVGVPLSRGHLRTMQRSPRDIAISLPLDRIAQSLAPDATRVSVP